MKEHTSTRARPGLWPLGFFAVAVGLGWALARGGEGVPIAEGGSPLYATALHESTHALAGGIDDTPAGGQVCPTCGKVHPLVPAAKPEDSEGAHYFCTRCQGYHHGQAPAPPDSPSQR